MVNISAKFDVSSFTCSRDMEDVPKFDKSHDPMHRNCHVF